MRILYEKGVVVVGEERKEGRNRESKKHLHKARGYTWSFNFTQVYTTLYDMVSVSVGVWIEWVLYLLLGTYIFASGISSTVGHISWYSPVGMVMNNTNSTVISITFKMTVAGAFDHSVAVTFGNFRQELRIPGFRCWYILLLPKDRIYNLATPYG